MCLCITGRHKRVQRARGAPSPALQAHEEAGERWLRVAHADVSGSHAKIIVRSGHDGALHAVLIDTSSTNGSHVRRRVGTRIQTHHATNGDVPLHVGDTIRLGEVFEMVVTAIKTVSRYARTEGRFEQELK